MHDAARSLNTDEAMQIPRLGGCEDFVSERRVIQELAFDSLNYFQPVKRA